MRKYLIPLMLVSVVLAIVVIAAADRDSEAPASPVNDSSGMQVEQNSNEVMDNTVVMLEGRYNPSRITIKRGESLTFVNRDGEEHWPASDNHPTHEEYSDFDPRRPIPPGESWTFTFNEAGAYDYHDHLFPQITGTITVEP